jgi:hypothetical protein
MLGNKFSTHPREYHASGDVCVQGSVHLPTPSCRRSLLRINQFLLCFIIVYKPSPALLIHQRCPSAIHARASNSLLLYDVPVMLFARLLYSCFLRRSASSSWGGWSLRGVVSSAHIRRASVDVLWSSGDAGRNSTAVGITKICLGFIYICSIC